MIGGLGDDVYFVDVVGDMVIENANEGMDTVNTSITYTLGANVENGRILASGTSNLTGNTLSNTLYAGAGNNILNGSSGTDTVSYLYATSAIQLSLANTTAQVTSGSGSDTLLNIENLTGSAYGDTLSGNTSTNTLDGGVGNDSMIGGLGDDVYFVDVVGDMLIENANEGMDTVNTSITYTLGANVENLTLLDGTTTNGTGNDLDNVLTGNNAANSLNGSTGADTMTGDDGSDTYYVDNSGDSVVETNATAASGGTDLVHSYLSAYTLGTNVENGRILASGTANLTGNTLSNTLYAGAANNILNGSSGTDTVSYLYATSAVQLSLANTTAQVTGGSGSDTLLNIENLTGSAYGDTLSGNASANTLNGGTGADTMTGGSGNDTYYVDNVLDSVIENSGDGTDRVYSSLNTYTLNANAENLTLSGTAAINGTGNSLSNSLTGNSAANILDGGAGTDTITGGLGNDTYQMGRGYGTDTVQESDTTVGNTDVLQFLSGIASNQIWLRQIANDLEVSIIGTTDKTKLTDWYLGNQYHVEQFKTSDGKTLLDSNVQNLVSAMAAFSPPAAGETTLSASYQHTLDTVMTANWR